MAEAPAGRHVNRFQRSFRSLHRQARRPIRRQYVRVASHRVRPRATTPIATLSVDGQYPYSCAVSSTGDLAVGNIESTTGDPGSVTIFTGATGSGTNYPDGSVYVSFVGYDKNALYVDGSVDGSFSLQSFKKGKFKTVNVAASTINSAGVCSTQRTRSP